MPVSRTATTAADRRRCTWIWTLPPEGVYRIAFDTKLFTTASISRGSAITEICSAHTMKVTPAVWAASPNRRAVSVHSTPMSTCSWRTLIGELEPVKGPHVIEELLQLVILVHDNGGIP